MSSEHVDAMNAILETCEPVREKCAALDKPMSMAYVLRDGPDGDPVYWTCTLTDTFRFALEPNPQADVTFVGDWKQMIRASAGGRDGQQIDPGVTIEGDENAVAIIGPIMETARAVATVSVDFPEL